MISIFEKLASEILFEMLKKIVRYKLGRSQSSMTRSLKTENFISKIDHLAHEIVKFYERLNISCFKK